ncbi:Hyaluronan synthase 3 [Podila humilis]|nr:Hyaluronan synthase 3 [Podila humilis]
MPPQPPEETSVLSHQSCQDTDPRLAIHPKDPLAFTAFQSALTSIGLKARTHSNGVLLLPLKNGDYDAPPPPTSPLPQENGQYFDHSLQHQMCPQPNRVSRQCNGNHSYLQPNGHVSIYEPNGEEHGFGIQNGYLFKGVSGTNAIEEEWSKTENSGCDSNSSVLPDASLLPPPTLEANGFLHDHQHLDHHHHTNGYTTGHGHTAAVTTFSSGPLTVTTATSLGSGRNLQQRMGSQVAPPGPMEPERESNIDEHNNHGRHPYHQHNYQSQQQQPQHPHPKQQQNIHSFDPFSTPSPAPSSYYSPFQSRYSTPVLQSQQLFQPTYESSQSSPIDLDHLHHYYSSANVVDPKSTASMTSTATTITSSNTTNPSVYPAVRHAKDQAMAQIYGLKSSHVSFWKKTIWVVFTMSIFLIPYIILKACFHIQVSAGAWQTSLTYGMLMAVDFMAVITFSTLNRRKVTKRVRKRDPHWVGLSTGILAVGYREDPTLLEGCLKSLRAIRYHRNQRVLLVVDGNETQDEYMAQIFLKVFEKQGAAVFRPDFLCMDRAASDKGREDLVRQIAYHPGPVCVMQPHRGKRSAMYTGFAALLQQGMESVVVTDSDTYLDPNVCRELAFALAESPVVGAATGDVRIYNTGTWVSFLSSVRYWFAFNLERGAQSYHSVVNCVSGPLGIYRMNIIADVMDIWVRQSFLGVLCTYGDDRHLTNLVLREGFKVKFSHYAICYTDTPIRFIAWVTQQTRWSKSFFREIPIQLGCMHLHSPWMTYALLYQLIYPLMMVYNLVNCIYFGTAAQISWWLVSISLVGLMKTIYASYITRDKKFFFTTIYGFLYIIGYVPAKIFAAMTLYDNSWGTSARLIRNFTQFQNYVAPVTWGLVLFLGAINQPTRYWQHTSIPEGQSPPMVTDTMIFQALALFGFGYLGIYLWFFVRTGVLNRDYKRDFSYEELFENMTSYTFVDGGKRKVARFEV